MFVLRVQNPLLNITMYNNIDFVYKSSKHLRVILNGPCKYITYLRVENIIKKLLCLLHCTDYRYKTLLCLDNTNHIRETDTTCNIMHIIMCCKTIALLLIFVSMIPNFIQNPFINVFQNFCIIHLINIQTYTIHIHK